MHKHFCLLLLLLASSITHASDKLLENSNCAVVYSLYGVTQMRFQEQREQMQPHLKRLRIRLYDLNDWQYHVTPLSGRERQVIRRTYDLRPREDNALMLFVNGELLVHQQRDIDLVSLVMTCAQTMSEFNRH